MIGQLKLVTPNCGLRLWILSNGVGVSFIESLMVSSEAIKYKLGLKTVLINSTKALK